MKNLILLIIFVVTISILAQDNIVEKEFKVFGNCGMCKSRIEKTMKIPEVKFAKWDKKTKMLKVAFETSITLDSLQKRLAAVGHDTEKFKANDDVYKNLPKCCLYRDNPATH